jgi:hypothetical protein
MSDSEDILFVGVIDPQTGSVPSGPLIFAPWDRDLHTHEKYLVSGIIMLDSYCDWH